MYLPLAGLVVLAAFAASSAARALAARERIADPKGPRRLLWGTTAVVCALLATGTLLRNREYQSRLLIAQTIVDRWPSGRGHFLLGNELLEAGQRDAAIVQFRESARDYPGAHFALGTELMVDGRFDEAAAELEAFLRLQPRHANVLAAHDLLGRAYLATGRLDDAAREFETVLREPRYPLHGQVLGMVDRIRMMKKD
jgi:tetratricopeptide (TPR) repeat protein